MIAKVRANRPFSTHHIISSSSGCIKLCVSFAILFIPFFFFRNFLILCFLCNFLLSLVWLSSQQDPLKQGSDPNSSVGTFVWKTLEGLGFESSPERSIILGCDSCLVSRIPPSIACQSSSVAPKSLGSSLFGGLDQSKSNPP